MNHLTCSLFYLYDNAQRKKIANFWKKRIYRRWETKLVVVSEVTPGNGVTSDSLKILIQILIANLHDFWNFKVWHLMLIFLYETGPEATKMNTLKVFWKITLSFWPFWRLVEWRHFRALVVVTILISNQCNEFFMTSATCRFQKTQKIRKIHQGPRKINEGVKIWLVSEVTPGVRSYPSWR